MKKTILTFIRDLKKKRFATDDLEKYVYRHLKQEYQEQGGYDRFHAVMEELVSENKILPVIARKTNGLFRPLYNYYQVRVEEAVVEAQLERRLLTSFHPKLTMTFYLKAPEQFQVDMFYLEAIDAFLRSESQNNPSCIVSVNERSFEIFGDEKWLTSKAGSALLNRIKVDLDVFNCYPTPEPFFYVKKSIEKPVVTALILENKDTFHTLRLLFKGGMNCWCGTTFDMLIYGEGKKILSSIDFLDDIEECRDKTIYAYYFGDIDPEGISIFSNLHKVAKVDVSPFIPFYESLIAKYRNRRKPKRSKEQENAKASNEVFFSFIDNGMRFEIKEIVDSGCYLPQEGLNRSDFLHLHGEEGDPHES